MHMAPLQAALVTLLLAPVAAMAAGSSAAPSVYRFELIHVDALAAHGAEHNSNNDDTYLDTATYSRREYLMELKMGTPPKPFKGVADTGSDVIWTRRVELQCEHGASSSFAGMACSSENKQQYECNECDKQQQQGGRYCAFSKRYGSKKMRAEGFLAGDVLTLPRKGGLPDKEVPISFGCARRCRDDKGDADCHRLIPKSADGVVGLNRGPSSLVNQLPRVTKFSYCLNDPLKPEQSSPLWFGGGADLELRSDNDAVRVQTTPLVQLAKLEPESLWKYKYYVELEGISVGEESPVVELPNKKGPEFNHKSLGGDNKGAMLLDSGCSYTHLEAAAFDPLTELLRNQLTAQVFQIKPPPDTDEKQHSKTCFRRPSWWFFFSWPRQRPDLVLHLRGGAKMHLRWTTYMTQQGNRSEFCLNIVNNSKSISILGNIHQQNMHMLYDLRAEKLSFLPVPDCSKREL
ncbi:unnamed protein product [Urochloa decumbens]|uniref:Peptidase A1 domain-containing protein n=1 Tax=Urochloa decumbens TaxID=240449 RepID=A0ABC8VK67_9POAL